MKGFTLLEVLISLFIISVVLLFSMPYWQQSEQQFLQKDQQNLYLFLRTIQARAENSSQIWLILANRNPVNNEWCLTAQVKRNQLCNCLTRQPCEKSLYAHFYYPQFPQKTVLISPKWYPTEVARFNGSRNTIDANCFVLQAGGQRTLFSFFNIGTIRLKSGQPASACS